MSRKFVFEQLILFISAWLGDEGGGY